MSAIVSEMDGGWREIVWKKERCGVGGGLFLFGEVACCGGHLSKVCNSRGGEIDLARKSGKM